jgi:ATP-dependent RNA helicase DeaD
MLRRYPEGRERSERSERPAYQGRERSGRGDGSSHEPGMVRLNLGAGRKDGIRPNDIVGAIAFHADIPGSAIGKIRIQEDNSWVDVPEQYVDQVLAKNGAVRIRRVPIPMQRA